MFVIRARPYRRYVTRLADYRPYTNNIAEARQWKTRTGAQMAKTQRPYKWVIACVIETASGKVR